MMKKILARIRELSAPVSVLLALGVSFALALALEIGVFQFSWIARHFNSYPEYSIDLSSMDGWNGEALVVTPDSPSVAFSDLSLPAGSVTVRTSGEAALVKGNVGICDEANAYKTVGAGSFQINPGGRESSFTVSLESHGNLLRLRLNFTEGLNSPIFLYSVTLNARQPLSIHWLRLMLLTGLLSAVLLCLRFRLYAREYRHEQRLCRLLNLGVLLFCLLVSCAIYYGENPEHQFLISYPTLEEVRDTEFSTDAYMQQLDAFEKGQIALDLDVDPTLEALDNPYDKGEREQKGAVYYWDRAYYNGKYYSYFGLAPLFMVYYPVYFLTGMLPTVSTAGFLLALFATVCVFGAIRGLLTLFSPRVNLLLLLTGETAVIGGSLIWLVQSSLTFYYLPLLAAAGWLSLFIALSCAAVSSRTAWKRALLFGLSGLSVVMLVLSRPNTVLLAMAFGAPLFLTLLFDRKRTLRERLVGSACPFLVPVLLGGAAIMYYNYIRFGSPVEFGTSYQLTESDIRWNSIYLSLRHFCSMIYHYFLEPFARTEAFPFLRFTSERCLNFGNYIYQEFSAGLFQLPLHLGVLLLPLYLGSKARENRTPLKKWILSLLLLGILCLGYLNYMLGGIHIRYVCDLALGCSLLSLLLVLDQVHFDGTRSARLLYLLTLAAFLITIFRGILLVFSSETNSFLYRNPDLWLYISRIFHG